MAAALCLRQLGATVELIEVDPAWQVYNAGITLSGASLRAFEALGVLDSIRRDGHIAGGVRLCAASGELLSTNPPTSDAIVHSGGGIMLTRLHSILSSATRSAGVRVTLGVSVTRITLLSNFAVVDLSDGRKANYDLIVGADGIHSQVRQMLFADATTPEFTGQGAWRIVAPRPAHVDRATIFVGGSCPLELIPVSNTQLYMSLLQRVPNNVQMPLASHVEGLRDLLAAYGGDAARVRDAIDRATPIVYRPLEVMLLPAPWHRSCVALIGDAVHATTPHLATGAGLAVEDSLVLAEELERARNIEGALEAYSRRRYTRCKAIVELSVEIGRCQLQNVAPPQIMALRRASSAFSTARW
jgi:2-polyprenyl-6-methoxyphenol hydroxylase-like FAD-dependent oxidoreductase